ncbi:endonuclease/exonuclease/phosphatase family protein [Streptomyces sp. ST2-7A]|uniref:endonuclease/exonuclease/phosphatase family protein n=1 Tax=Streptomyces sp. ST2-7A TaxID=2907214 RepID=UPI001F49194F|nr:endonuclease/exonuclease/phosphatase family protein [Streptomyces sp. ST2-7A]MCE7079788.1 endonuclease/exonuclease/phosphatase family protein [Streptomyces sp. ST2-7A]
MSGRVGEVGATVEAGTVGGSAVGRETPEPEPSPPRPRVRAARLLGTAILSWTLFVSVFWILTGRHWWWRPMELMPPPVFLVVPLLLLLLTPLARTARLRLAAATLCCGLLGLPLVGLNVHALPGVGGVPDAPPEAVRVFSWNTEYWTDGDDPDEFYAYLRAQRADVYLLQEHVSWDLDAHRPIPADHVGELREHFPGFHVVAVGELLTLSRYPIDDWRGLDSWPHLSDPAIGMPPDGRFPDYYRYKVLRTDLRIDGRVTTFYNVHIPVQLDISMNPFSSRFVTFMRAQEVRRQATYRALEEDLDDNRLPVVVAGDLNGTSAMGEVRRLGERLRDALHASDELYPVSWPTALPGMWRLDRAFTGESVTVHDYRMVDSGGMSDHRAQALTLSFDTE